MEMLLLVSVFWESHEEENGEDATVHVEDGIVVYITRPDGLEVRLLITELEFVYYFALEQMHRREDGDATDEVLEFGRMQGCQSTNHINCHGELWQCGKCGKTVCCNEGSDDDPDLCDDCWAKKDSPQILLDQSEDDIPF